MWVKVIGTRAVPYVGQPGAVRKIDNASGKALILLGKVVPVDAEGGETVLPPKKRKATETKVTKKATYKRRDLRAESKE